MTNPLHIIADHVNQAIDVVTSNVWPIAIGLFVLFIIRDSVLPVLSRKSYSLKDETKSRSSGGNATTREDDIRKVREKQQQLADFKAKAAAIERKKKEDQEKSRKNNLDSKSAKSVAKAKGGSKQPDACYNPMQPWSSGSTSYRPAKRTVRRG